MKVQGKSKGLEKTWISVGITETLASDETKQKKNKTRVSGRMSCFWTALCAKVPGLQKHSPSTVIEALQSVNCLTRDVLWNDEELQPVQMVHNCEWVRAYDPNSYGNGHDTSIADPFLFLVAQVFRLRIRFAYTGPVWRDNQKTGEVTTTHTFCHRDANPKDTVQFYSTIGHFS